MSGPITPLRVARDGFALAGEVAGAGPAVLLLHGLTATRRYVLHGSRALERAGHRVIAYDARGHGASGGPAAPGAYGYAALAEDALAVLDAAGEERAALVGHSMGAATAAAVALRAPERVTALVAVTPAHLGRPAAHPAAWDARADALGAGGPEAFLDALEPLPVSDRYRETVRTVIRQRLSRHAHPALVAAALRGTPRSAAFDGPEALARVAAPTLVVGSRNDADPDHPLAVAEEWARRIPGARLLVEAPGESPLAWRGAALSAAILELLAAVPPGRPRRS